MNMVKTQAVMELVEFSNTEELLEFATENPTAAAIEYALPDENALAVDDDGYVYALRSVALSLNDWNDLDRPEKITVTIVPGDSLND